LKGHDTSVESVAFSPDGKRLVAAGEELKVWDTTSGKGLLTLEGTT
jgi:WD40 repeat protein